jgi:hypothetical protein
MMASLTWAGVMFRNGVHFLDSALLTASRLGNGNQKSLFASHQTSKTVPTRANGVSTKTTNGQ